MRHLRPFLALLAMAALIAACSTPGSGSPDESNGGGGATATPDGGGGEATATPGGGGGGGGGGANGSITYNISGDYDASGELPFLTGGVSLWIESAGGWVANFANTSGEGAYILLNTQDSEGTPGQILTFGDGTVIIAAASGESTGYDCTFNLTKNDSGGLSGSMECNDIFGSNATTGALLTVDISAEWDAHP